MATWINPLLLDADGRMQIEVCMGDTAFGTIWRTVHCGKKWRARVNGESLILHDTDSTLPKVQVVRLPRDLDTGGYE